MRDPITKAEYLKTTGRIQRLRWPFVSAAIQTVRLPLTILRGGRLRGDRFAIRLAPKANQESSERSETNRTSDRQRMLHALHVLHAPQLAEEVERCPHRLLKCVRCASLQRAHSGEHPASLSVYVCVCALAHARLLLNEILTAH